MTTVTGVIEDVVVGSRPGEQFWALKVFWLAWKGGASPEINKNQLVGVLLGTKEDLIKVGRSIPPLSIVTADLDMSEELVEYRGRFRILHGPEVATEADEELARIAQELAKPVIRKEKGLGTFTFERSIEAWTGKLAGKTSIFVMLNCGEFDFDGVKPVLLNARDKLAELTEAGASYAVAYSKEWVDSGIEEEWSDAIESKLRESLKLRTIQAWPEGRIDLTFSGNRNLLANHEVVVQFSPEGKPISGKLIG
ncbi:MAG: hypothetical protein KDA83_20540 [Planctomycetales bacterium]|nr:hypothetical protein [Planctomycetales bacterium]